MRLRVLVVGFGNVMRGDDGAGCRVAEAIAERWSDTVTVRVGPQLVPEWATDLAEADIAFFVDASSLSGDRIRLRELQPGSGSATLDGHALGPERLLQLTAAVYGSSPSAHLLELPATKFEFGDGLSSVASAGVRRAIELLERRLSALI